MIYVWLLEITLFLFHLPDFCLHILQIIQHVVKVLGTENSVKILSSVSPLLTFAGLEVRVAVCNVLNALSESDSSLLSVVILIFLTSSLFFPFISYLGFDKLIHPLCFRQKFFQN